MKRLLLLLLTLTLGLFVLPAAPALADVAVISDNFPDYAFRSYVADNFDSNGDGWLSADELAIERSVYIDETMTVRSLEGIQYLTSLISLTYDHCENLTQQQTVDLSGLTHLNTVEMKSVGPYYSDFRELDLTGCTSLEYLLLDHNRNLNTLGITGCPILKTLSVKDCELSYTDSPLDLSGSPQLSFVCLNGNYWVKNLNLSGLTQLTNLQLSGCGLDQLSLSGLTKLTLLDVSETHLTALDLSGNQKLVNLDCHGISGLTQLDLSHQPSLRELSCYGTGLTSLNISACPYLVSTVTNGTHGVYSDPDTGFYFYDYYVYADAESDIAYDEGLVFITVKAPVINTQPHDNGGLPGSGKVSFTVEASDPGSLPLTYQWYVSKNGGDSWSKSTGSGNQTDTLLVTLNAAYSGYQYKCIVSNGQVATESGSATLTVIQDLGAYELDISQCTLCLSADSQQGLALWDTLLALTSTKFLITPGEFNTDLDGNGEADIHSAKQYLNSGGFTAGYYYCFSYTDSTNLKGVYSVSPTAGQIADRIATSGSVPQALYSTVNVNFGTPLQITRDLYASYSAAGSGTVPLHVEAQGVGLSYQWETYYNSTWSNSSYSGNQTSTMNVPTGTAYQFRCKVTDAYGKEVYSTACTVSPALDLGSCTLDLTSAPPIVLSETVADALIGLGEAGSVDMLRPGEIKPEDNGGGLIWIPNTYRFDLDKDGYDDLEYAPGTGEISVYPFSYMTGSATWAVPFVVGDRSYAYTQLTIDFGHRLAIVNWHALQLVIQGRTATYHVDAVGQGLSYQWRYSKDGGSTWANATASGNKTATLSVPATASRDGNQYKCVVTDSYNNTVESYAFLLDVVPDRGDYTIDVSSGPQIVVTDDDNMAYEEMYYNVPCEGSIFSGQMKFDLDGDG
ncbi:MAG: hypothetical protein IK116_06350, partial [Firmicutes bacterium]|nr:hypothetical protein [Bacillota bacterium]